MGDPAPLDLGGCLARREWSTLIKKLDADLSQPPQGDQDHRLQLLLNRGFCLQQLGLFRKALKVAGLPRAPLLRFE